MVTGRDARQIHDGGRLDPGGADVAPERPRGRAGIEPPRPSELASEWKRIVDVLKDYEHLDRLMTGSFQKWAQVVARYTFQRETALRHVRPSMT